MIFQVTEILFDLTDSDLTKEEEIYLQQSLQEEYVNIVYDVEEEDDLTDVISNLSGWCIQSIDYKSL